MADFFYDNKENFNTTSVFIKRRLLDALATVKVISIQLLFLLNIRDHVDVEDKTHFNTTSVFIKQYFHIRFLHKKKISIQLLFLLNKR